MRIGVFVRTFRDLEERHIQRFIETHAFADTIYVGTCMTSNTTHNILSRYPKVKTKEFGGLVQVGDEWLANESQYYTFLYNWSIDEDLDWVLFDDADHYCSPALQRDARAMLTMSDAPFAYALLMYVWGTTHYFPELNKCCPKERLWGWNPHKWQPDINPDPPFTIEIRNQPDKDIDKALVFPAPPYAILHHSFLTESDVQRKMDFNHRRGVAQRHPLESCGHLEPIPEWARLNGNSQL